MTAAPVLSPPDSPYEPPSRRPTWPRWRPAFRLAIRDTRAHQGRSALIVALVALPVGLVVGAALWSATRDRSAGGDPVTDGLIPDGVMLGIAVGFVQIVLLAGAAFAVSARRRQRELALLAAAGAEPGDLTRAVIGVADIDRTAARLGTKRSALRQYLAFLTCVCAFLLGATAAYFLWPRADAAAPAHALWFVGAPMALTLLIAPLMAYFLEKEREHEKA